VDSNKKVPEVYNEVMKEYYGDYRAAYHPYRLKMDILNASFKREYYDKQPDSIKVKLENQPKEGYAEHDRILLNYVSSHPNSYIAFWNF